MKNLMHTHSSDGNTYPDECPLCRIYQLEDEKEEIMLELEAANECRKKWQALAEETSAREGKL